VKKASVLEWVTTLATLFGLFFVWRQLKQSTFQLQQANQHKRWDNYNTMNEVYREMYNRLQTNEYKQLQKPCLNYDTLELKEKAWIRSYYNLYAQEFDLDQAGLLPKDMMDETISRGFKFNLRQYPSIVEGFQPLIAEGAFSETSEFAIHVKTEIQTEEKSGPFPKCIPTLDIR